jgi:hypothetical protein
VDRHFYDTLDTVMYDNRPYKIPSDIGAYLTRRFGNWRVPDSTYDSSLDDPSCVD